MILVSIGRPFACIHEIGECALHVFKDGPITAGNLLVVDYHFAI
jgi:hypothetical protein